MRRTRLDSSALRLIRGEESLRAVAMRGGISHSAIQRAENGERIPSLGTLEGLARAYQTTFTIRPDGSWIEDEDDLVDELAALMRKTIHRPSGYSGPDVWWKNEADALLVRYEETCK
jgi:transcriptional regulator with XRE-family HTH domain